MTTLELLEDPGIHIGGRKLASSDRTAIEDLDPSTGAILATVPSSTPEDVQLAIDTARATQPDWARRPPGERGRIMVDIARRIRSSAEELAQAESLDTGKPMAQAKADVEVAAQYFEFYGGYADKLYGDTIPLDGSRFAATLREPLGVTGHIIPWNYPLQIGSRTAAPSLMAGNACVVKPAPEAPLTTIALAELATEAGLPGGLLNVVPGDGEVTGAYLAGSDDIDHLSFTGGVETGRLVMHAVADNLKPITMELGGKSPSVVLDDADLDRAIPVITKALIQNAGQTCSAGTRLIVHNKVYEEVLGRLADSFANISLGAGVDDPDMGPLISRAQCERVLGYLSIAAEEGVEVVTGGNAAEVPGKEGGYFVQPTLLTSVDPSMRVAREEIFGPVLAVLTFVDDIEAADLANSTEYGLIAAVWTRNVDRALWLARHIQAGQVYINSYGAGGGVALPFGGFRRSGFGREKGLEAIHEYTQTKTIAFEVSEPQS